MALKLLLADDEAYITTVLSQKLDFRFEEIHVANDGEEALALARLHIPDVIVSDYQMPVIDGFAFATALRADPATAHIPVILLTARGHLLSPAQLALTNIQKTLAKPFSVKEVVAAVEALLAAECQRKVA